MARSHKIDISGLLAGGRQLMLVDDEVPIEAFEGVTFQQPARVQLELREADRMLVIEGEIDVRGHGPCDRCLEDVEREIHADVEERIDPSLGRDDDPFGEGNGGPSRRCRSGTTSCAQPLADGSTVQRRLQGTLRPMRSEYERGRMLVR
jgi:hypothetical protein